MRVFLFTLYALIAPVLGLTQPSTNAGEPIVVKGVSLDIKVKKVVNGVACDSCFVNKIYNQNNPVSYVILNATEDESISSGILLNTSLSHSVASSTHAITERVISVNFLSPSQHHFPPVIWPAGMDVEFEAPSSLPIEFSVYLNSRMIQDWRVLSSQPIDSTYEIGYDFPMTLQKTTFIKWLNYNAGSFNLNINDSIVILIKYQNAPAILQSITINRIKASPTQFDFIKFSSDKSLQDILNSESYQLGIPGESVNNFNMKPTEIALLRFRDARVPNNEVEYAFSNNPDIWKTLSGKHMFPSQLFYILINNPSPGKTIELLLRYKAQPETIHRVTISVGESFFSSTWFKVLITLMAAILSFTVWYLYKKRQHTLQIKKLTLSKEETESKLQLLSGQLNPHFLFNSLNSVQNLINKNDTQNANLYISEVSSFLRTIMDTGKKEYISLEEELKIEETYMQLEQKRKDFQYEIINNCGYSLSQIEFPPLLLQPIIENSIHHGFTRDVTNPILYIKINCTNNRLHVRISDNGQGFDTAATNQGHGISIIRKRISLVNEKLKDLAINMNIESTEKGTITTFQFQNWL